MKRVVRRLITKAAGATKIFQRSVEKHGVRYISYYGVEESKSYEEVKNVYPGKVRMHRALTKAGW